MSTLSNFEGKDVVPDQGVPGESPAETLTPNTPMVRASGDVETGSIAPDFLAAEHKAARADLFEVTFDGPDDPRNAHNWPLKKKLFQTVLITIAHMYAAIGTSVLDGGNQALQERFGVGVVVASLANSVFILGLACGPQVFGPMSEVLGRKPPIVIGVFLSAMFAVQSAGAANLATVIIGRFFAGVFGSAPFAVGGGVFHDIYDAVHVQGGVSFIAAASAGGPAIGPVIGAGLFSTSKEYGWRWIGWFTLIFGTVTTLLLLFFMEESYAPAILGKIAKHRRHDTQEWAWHAKVDTIRLEPRDIFVRYVSRPIKMLFFEPMLLVISIYMSFVYALLYMLMAALPIIYGEYRGMSVVVSSLPFVAVFIGVFFGAAFILIDMFRYMKKVEEAGVDCLPEQRFIPMAVGAIIFPIGLFWFAFTGPAQCDSPWPSIIALGFMMSGSVLIFETGMIYLIDMYRSFANSAIAGNTLMRSIVGGTFPLFTPAMVRCMGYSSTWSMALLAFIALFLSGIPIIFYYTGARIRAMSKFTLTL